jgi:hypothetical protein
MTRKRPVRYYELPKCGHAGRIIILHPASRECKFCGERWVVPPTIDECLQVPEVLDLIKLAAAGYDLEAALAPFLLAMKKLSPP